MGYSLRHIKRLLVDIKACGLSVPAGFWNKSPQWIKRHYNGIGAEWMPEWVRRFVTNVFNKIESPCLIHDIEYLEKKKTYWNFSKANLRLAYNAIKKRKAFAGSACAVICQLFGWSAFKEGKEFMAYYYYYKVEDKNGTH